jgi:outer membrane immunogenic protein
MLAVAAAVIGPAWAEDLYPNRAIRTKDGLMYSPIPIWSGFYFGGHVGGTRGNQTVTPANAATTPDLFFSSLTHHPNATLAGLQAGYNWQLGNFVFGFEAVLGAMDADHKASPPNLLLEGHQRRGRYGDLTGRLGYAFGRALVYTKGGVAFFDGEAEMTVAEGAILLAIITPTKIFTGWTVGFGLEFSLSPTWSLKAEYQHFDFGKEQSNFNPGGFAFDHTLVFDSVRFGLNYHLGGDNR